MCGERLSVPVACDGQSRPARRGSILIIVVGLAAILLVTVTAFLVRMRSDAQEMRGIVAEAESRIMLHAALNYIQESSLLGWLPSPSANPPAGVQSRQSLEQNNDATLCFGWTDLRDGTLGPKGPRDPTSAASLVLNIPAIPWPAWACTMAWNFSDAKRKAMFSPVDTELPAAGDPKSGGRMWPCPGTVVRCPMARAERPPFATRVTMAYNSVPGWDTAGNEVNYDPNDLPGFENKWPNVISWWGPFIMPYSWVPKIFDPNRGAVGALDPQPADPESSLTNPVVDPYTAASNVDSWGVFVRGKPETGTHADWTNHRPDRFGNNGVPGSWTDERLAIVPGTENVAWFRVYRETLSDHDNDGDPFYDRVALNEPSSAIAQMDPASLTTTRNWNVFIIACGAGPTRGYRFWHLDSGDPRRALEPTTAEESKLWSSQQEFEQALALSSIMWFRVEWSGHASGGLTTWIYDDPGNPDGSWTKSLIQQLAFRPGGGIPINYIHQDSNHTYNQDAGINPKAPYFHLQQRDIMSHVQGGSFRFIQRLDREPPAW